MWSLFTQSNNIILSLVALSFFALLWSEGILFKLIMVVYLTIHVGLCLNFLSSSYWCTMIFLMNVSGVAVLYVIFSCFSSKDNISSDLWLLLIISIPTVQVHVKTCVNFYFGWIWSSSFLYLFLGILLLLLMVSICMIIYKFKCPFRPFI